MRISVDCGEPRDWDPPKLILRLTHETYSNCWPKYAVLESTSFQAGTNPNGHPRPEVYDESLIVGRRVSLRLRHQFPDASPTVEDAPTVYVTLDPDEPTCHLVGYGEARTL